MNLSLPAFFDILIGITFIYLILSLLASEIQELIAAFLQFRAKHLKKSIYIMLGGTENSRLVENWLKGLDDNAKISEASNLHEEDKKAIKITNKLYANSLIASLTQSTLGFRLRKLTNYLYGPSYLPSETFATALIEILEETLEVSNSETIVTRIISKCKIDLLPKKLQRNLYELAGRARWKADNANQVDNETYLFLVEIENWFNRSQNRTSGTYKRNTKFVLFWIGLITAFFANANAFQIVSSLYYQGTVRNIVTQVAVNAVNNCKDLADLADPNKTNCLDTLDTKIKETIEADQLPIGWNFSSPSPAKSTNSNSQTISSTASSLEQIKFQLIQLRGLVINLLGWVVSALAINMGAPFWFDLLNKFVNVRNAGPKPPSSTES